ncbi:MAG TPA: VWA domain-containing protein, partial [Thermoanaerobaculia bacterium]|nr:VWA domain-containing protein [Thermoanaerobaculia bacterium]
APAPAAGEAPAATAPETTPDDLEVFVDTVDVRVVNVDVFVTDKKGNPVSGLDRDDFELVEDGRPVAITNFYAVEEGRPRGGLAPGQIADLPLPPPDAPQPIEIPEEQRLHLVVYVDNFNIRPANRNRVLDDVGYFLTTQLDRDDRVMLVTYDRTLNVRQAFTSDPRLIAGALDEVERVTGHAVARDDERRRILEQIEESRTVSAAASYARMHAESMDNDLRFTIGALKELIGTLAGLPGRKAILYVSDGVPMVPGQDVFYAVDAQFAGQGASGILTDSMTYDASREFRELAAQANASRVSFYTLDAAGLRLDSSFSAQNARPTASHLIDSTFNSNHQSPLRFLADTTGGMAIVNTNNVLPALGRVARDFDTYYSLGFSPTHAANGRYHRVEVRVVGRRDLVVRHREGYRDKTIEARMTDGTVAALHFDSESNPLGARLRFTDTTRQEGRFYQVNVDVEVPIGELVLVPHGETHEARLRLFIAARDSEGDSSPVQQLTVPISIPNGEVEAARKQLYRYSVPLVMRPGAHRVAVGLRDELGGEEAFLTTTVIPGRGGA